MTGSHAGFAKSHTHVLSLAFTHTFSLSLSLCMPVCFYLSPSLSLSLFLSLSRMVLRLTKLFVSDFPALRRQPAIVDTSKVNIVNENIVKVHQTANVNIANVDTPKVDPISKVDIVKVDLASAQPCQGWLSLEGSTRWTKKSRSPPYVGAT